MITGIAHGAVTVKDMEQSLKFYVDALGFERAFDIDHPETGAPWIVYLHAANGQFIELFYGGTQDCPWNGALIGFSHFCFEVDDIYAAVARIKAAGFELDSEPKQGSDYNLQAWVKDPNGVRIELMQIDPRSPQAKFYNK